MQAAARELAPVLIEARRACVGGLRCALASVLLVLLVALDVQAESRALLVGVSGYPSLPAHLRLSGPRNDVLRMREVLLQRGVRDSSIEVLADGVTGAALPTRANILAALDRLARNARRGDLVILHFAGHGSRQPADPSTTHGRREGDGRHAIFLPLDVGRWNGQAGVVDNAIVSHELRAAVDAISERGADVFALFDACHSAALVRGSGTVGAQGELSWRYVPPHELGLEPEGLPPTDPAGTTRGSPRVDVGALGAIDAGARPAGAGRTAFFYATQASELTPELRLPLGAGQRRVHGLFSFVITKALASGRPMSYRQLGQWILAEYGSMMEARATPLFTGNGLDALVLGQRDAVVRQWPLEVGETLSVPAGALAGLEEGAVLAVLPDAAAADNDAIAYVAVSEAEAGRARVVASAWAGTAAAPASVFRAGQVARLTGTALSLALRVGLDLRQCASDCALRRVAAVLRERGVPGVEAQWVDAPSAADVVLRQVGNHIVFLAPTRRFVESDTDGALPAMLIREGGASPPEAEIAAKVAGNLHRIARARNLLKLAARAAADERSEGPLQIDLRRHTEVQPSGLPMLAENVSAVRSGDRLTLALTNSGRVPLDVTVLYLDAHFGITTLFPNRLGESNRIAGGTRQEVADIQIHAPPEGLERLLIIGVSARRLAERSDFSFLDQPALTLRGSQLSEDMLALADAAFAAHRERGAARPAVPGNDLILRTFALNVAR